MADPVRIIGQPREHVFEREAIRKWLSQNLNNPMTNQPVSDSSNGELTRAQIRALLEDASDIQVLLDALWEFIPCSWGRIRRWRDALCTKRNLDANKMAHPHIMVTQYPKQSKLMHRWYSKVYMRRLFTITSVAAEEYALVWDGSDLKLKKKTDPTATAENATFYVDLGPYNRATIAPYGRYNDQLFAQDPVKEDDAPDCSIVDAGERYGYGADGQNRWWYESCESEGSTQRKYTIRLGVQLFDLSGRKHFFINIHDEKAPSLRWINQKSGYWSSDKKQNAKQMWRLTPIFSTNELEVDLDC
jgi:hypothetical protein